MDARLLNSSGGARHYNKYYRRATFSKDCCATFHSLVLRWPSSPFKAEEILCRRPPNQKLFLCLGNSQAPHEPAIRYGPRILIRRQMLATVLVHKLLITEREPACYRRKIAYPSGMPGLTAVFPLVRSMFTNQPLAQARLRRAPELI